MNTQPIISHDLFRGQSNVGLGEGPATDPRRPGGSQQGGEQWLGVDQIFWNDAILRDLRLLMCFSPYISPVDKQDAKLENDLESWRCCTRVIGGKECTVVVRSKINRPFEKYDRRHGAYFSHARFFPQDVYSLKPNATSEGDPEVAFHPGTLVGHGEMFDDPWLDVQTGEHRAFSPVSAVPNVLQGIKGADGKTTVNHTLLNQAAQLLAWSLQAHNDGKPLMVLPQSVESLRAGTNFNALLGFMRTALPPHLRQKCFLDINEREIDTAMYNGATIIVPPVDELHEGSEYKSKFERATSANSLCIDEQGNSNYRRNGEVDPYFRQYAETIAYRAAYLPQGLIPFTELIRDLNFYPSADLIPDCYNYAYALRHPDPEFAKAVARNTDKRGFAARLETELGTAFQAVNISRAEYETRFKNPHRESERRNLR